MPRACPTWRRPCCCSMSIQPTRMQFRTTKRAFRRLESRCADPRPRRKQRAVPCDGKKFGRHRCLTSPWAYGGSPDRHGGRPSALAAGPIVAATPYASVMTSERVSVSHVGHDSCPRAPGAAETPLLKRTLNSTFTAVIQAAWRLRLFVQHLVQEHCRVAAKGQYAGALLGSPFS
jgi:hypothetical protein